MPRHVGEQRDDAGDHRQSRSNLVGPCSGPRPVGTPGSDADSHMTGVRGGWPAVSLGRWAIIPSPSGGQGRCRTPLVPGVTDWCSAQLPVMPILSSGTGHIGCLPWGSGGRGGSEEHRRAGETNGRVGACRRARAFLCVCIVHVAARLSDYGKRIPLSVITPDDDGLRHTCAGPADAGRGVVGEDRPAVGTHRRRRLAATPASNAAGTRPCSRSWLSQVCPRAPV